MTSVQKITWNKEEIKLVAEYLVKIASQSKEDKIDLPTKSETLKHEKIVEEAKIGIAEALITKEINEEALVEDQKIKKIMEFSQIPQPKTVERVEKQEIEKIGVLEERQIEFEEEKIEIEEMGEITIDERKIEEQVVEEKIGSDILSLAKEIGQALTKTEKTEDMSIVKKIETEDLSAEVVTEPILDKPVEIRPEDFPEDIRDIALEEIPAKPEKVEIKQETKEEIPAKPEKVEIKQETKEEIPAKPEKQLTEEQIRAKKREEIIQKMLAETKKREQEAGVKVYDMGETAGKKYSAVIIGQESSKNIKKWKKVTKKKKKSKK
ncbi:MAG: hypothetical protein ACTSXD_04270 [Candidatus Heimdallarchaeaceae archaeon]